MTTSDTLTLVFAAFLLAHLAVRFWLTRRQVRHVSLHRDAVPAPFEGRISLPAHQKAADYTIAKSRVAVLEMAFAAAVLLGWTLLGGLDALNRALLQSLGPGMLQQLALLGAFGLISGLLDLPFSLYQTFVVEQRFGFNKMTWRLWLVDLVKSTAIGLAIGAPIAWLILWIMGAAGTWWWLLAWGVWMGLNLLLLVIYPTLIAPLFNKFQPLTNEALRARVTALMQRCGFAVRGLFVMDGSKRSAHANAYFTGFGAAKRVVFYDTLLNKLSPPEVDAVLAHELGHFAHKHIVKRIVAMFALSLLGFALLGWLANASWFYTGLGVQPNLQAPNDALALLLFLLVVPVFTFFVSPLMAQLSRRHEFEADAFAVAQTSGHDLSSALLKLYEDNASTLTPDPVYVRFYYFASSRIGAAPAPGSTRRVIGLVVAGHGRHVLVEQEDGTRLICHPRGKKSQAVVGDLVRWQPTGDQGTVEEVEARRNLFYRQDEVRVKSFAANLDVVLILIAAEPEFSEHQLTRALIAAEAQHITPLIALNKSDLVEPFERAWKRLLPYQHMHYGVMPLSLRLSGDVDREHLLKHLTGKSTLVLGPSGAGKSTLINLLVPGAQALTGEISQALSAGRHTTTSTTLYWVDRPSRTALIDSPGFQEFGLHHIDAMNLATLMRDLRPHIAQCRFYNCTHLHEPACGVRDAVARGEVADTRYRIYGELFAELSQPARY